MTIYDVVTFEDKAANFKTNPELFAEHAGGVSR